MDPEEIEYFRNLKKEERRCVVPSLVKNLEERSLGNLKKKVTSKEYRELIAEELLIEKEKYDELRCEMPGIPRSTFLMVFSPDGTKVASTHGNHNIYITDIRSGKNMKTLVGHPRTPWCIAFHPTSNQIIASGCLGGQVRIWDLSGGSEVWTATNQTVIASIAFHPMERILVIATSNEVYFWDWSKPEPFLHTSTGSQKEKVRYVAFDKLGHRLITGISNNHSRWEYVRSSERTSEHPVRHFNITSRRPVLRRGFFPVRHNVPISSSSNPSREIRSRVPERERNITMSYRNLVRQYGRLVQRYLQLYRPPAMIDRGTDPMENTVAPTSNSTGEPEPDTSVSSDTASVSAPDQPSNSSQNNQTGVTRRYMDILDNPVRCTPPPDNPSLSRKHKNDSNPQNHIPRKRMKLSGTDNVNQPTTESDSPQPSTSGLSGSQSQISSVEELTRSVLAGIINVLNRQISPTSSSEQHGADRSETNNTGISQSSSSQTGVNMETGEPAEVMTQNPSFISEEMTRDRPGENNTGPYQRLRANTEEHTVDEVNQEEFNEQPVENTINQSISREFNNDTQEIIQDTTETNVENGHDITNNQTENAVEVSSLNSPVMNSTMPGTSNNDIEVPTNLNDEQAIQQIVGSLDTTCEETPKSPSIEVSTSSSVNNTPSKDSMTANVSCSSSVTDPMPGTSTISEDHPHGEDQTLENMMMNMRRTAEDNLRARFMPLIQSRVPENDREELIRLFEESVRESREKARLRYRNMGQIFNRQPSREPVFTSSDSSSSEDERDCLHMNFYIRSRADSSSRQTENLSDAGSSTQRSRGSAYPSGNNSYHNINNLESWVTSLFDDVDSPSANTNERNAAGTIQTTNSTSTPMTRHRFSDLPIRITPRESQRNEINLSVPANNSSSSSLDSPPNPAGNISTGTTNSTIYSQARRERRLGHFRSSDLRSAFLPARRTPEQFRRVRMSPGYRRRAEASGIRSQVTPGLTVNNNFARDEVINFSELPNSEDDPFLTAERSEPFIPTSTDSFHPFNPPPNLPTIDPENIGIGNMYSNIVQDLETSLNNARDIRTVDRPGEMSNMLSNFSNRLEHLMNQSEGILRNLRTSVEVLPDNDPLDYGEEAPIPTASFNDSTFFVRDQRTEGASLGSNLNSTSGYDIRQNNATSDHTYPRNSDSPNPTSNLNESMSPLMNSLHLTLSHIQSQSRLLHRQVECIERIDRAMVEVSQLQLMRLLLAELSTYVRNRSGESRSTSMSSVRQMMAGTRISDYNPSEIQDGADAYSTSTGVAEPSTSTGGGNANQGSARSRGSPRKTYPPSRLNRPRELPRSGRNSRGSTPTTLPSVAPQHTFSQITVFTLIRMDRRLQSLIDDHSTRFSHHQDFFATNSRRVVHELGEHNLALRLRESITRTNRLAGNIFNANVVRNYRIDSSTSMRHGIERFYERTLLSLIIDGISSHLDQNGGVSLSAEMRTRMQNVLQLAMMLSDLLLLYTINSLAPTTDVNLESERRILATRIAETCSTMIRCRQYRNYSNSFVQSLRSLRLMVSAYSSSPYSNLVNPVRGYVRPQAFRSSSLARQLVHLTRATNNELANARNSSNSSQTMEESVSNRDNSGEAAGRESSNTSSNNSPLINACLYLARRQRAQHQQDQASASAVPEQNSQRDRQTRNTTNSPLINACLYLNRRQRAQNSLDTSRNSETEPPQNSGNNTHTRRRNSTDFLINTYLTAGRNRTSRPHSNGNEERRSPQNVHRNQSYADNRTNRSDYFNPYRDISLITSRSTDPQPTTENVQGSNNDLRNRNSPNRTRGNWHMFRSGRSGANTPNNTEHIRPSEQNRRLERDEITEPQSVGPSPEPNSWWESTLDHLTSDFPEDRHLYGGSNEIPSLSPSRNRPSTSSNSENPEPSRYWRIPSVQVNDVPVSDLGPPLDNPESDNSSNAGANNNNPTYPRVMARLAAIRSVSVYNPMGVLRPRLLHPFYATLNPFDADLEQREHIYDSDVISTVTPNHRIQVWDISDSIIPEINDPLKNLVVRECKIHNDASVDIASDGSILVTLLPSGGYVNITNRLGVYSLRWETLGQCLYTTSFVHNAVSVSLSPLGRHLVVGLASRRVSILPNDRWMMASIFKIEEKDTPGDHLPFVRQIDRGTDERATSHKSVNCIRWLPTSGQGLIYATNTGQLNIWT